MTRYINLGFALIFAASLSPSLFAQSPAGHIEAPSVAAEKFEIMTAKVKGMVCDFCAQAVTKIFSKQEGVEHVTVDLDKAEVIVTMAAGYSLDDETIKSLIRKSGYALVEIGRAST